MKRLAKGDGYGNVYLEDAPVPAVTSRGVLVRAHTSLISRGSEILREALTSEPRRSFKEMAARIRSMTAGRDQRPRLQV